MDIKQLRSYWNIRVSILVSLLMQVILIFLGRWRKKSTSRWIKMFVWSTYILADWVADFALGILSRAMNDSASNAIITFWAPFLILHLGGLDTITAYSMEDNELWPRRLLGLGYELAVTFYVLFCSLPNTYLLIPTLLIFLVGTIKCVERIYCLYKASSASFHNSIGSFVGELPTNISSTISKMEDLNDLNAAFGLYSSWKHFFVDVIPQFLLPYNVTGNLVQEMTAKKALRVTGMELSYAYDELYTKATINHSKVGYVLRALCSICLLLAVWLFVLAPKDSFNKFDVIITNVLLVASIFLDITAVLMLLFSDEGLVSLLNAKKPCNWTKFLAKCIVRIRIFCFKEMYWSGEMPQLNLISDCKNFASNKALHRKIINWIEEKLNIVQKIELYSGWNSIIQADTLRTLKLYPGWKSTFRTHTLRTLKSVYATQELQEIIITYAKKCLDESKKKLNELAGLSTLRQVTTIPTWVVPSFVKLMEGLSLDQQVLVCHIATNLLFHWKSESHHPLYSHQIDIEVENNNIREVMRNSSEMEACMYLSNYMMHMVLMRLEIMSTMGGESSSMFWKAYDDMVHFIKSSDDGHDLLKPNAKVAEVCRKMLSAPIELSQYSTLFQMARVLSYLMLVIEKKERWIIITMVWVELMMQGLTNTKASILVKQLSRGLELFTFIWLLYRHVRMEKTPIHEGYMMSGALEAANEILTNIIELYAH